MRQQTGKSWPPLSQTQDKPVHEHDCGVCLFLGHRSGFDVYYCEKQGPTLPTIIVRWGSGPEYGSGAAHFTSGEQFASSEHGVTEKPHWVNVGAAVFIEYMLKKVLPERKRWHQALYDILTGNMPWTRGDMIERAGYALFPEQYLGGSPESQRTLGDSHHRCTKLQPVSWRTPNQEWFVAVCQGCGMSRTSIVDGGDALSALYQVHSR